MKKFIQKIIILLIPFWIMVGLNLFIDSASLFNYSRIGEMVSKLQEGYHIVGIVNYDERVFQREVVQQVETPPRNIVLGSSRIMQVGSGSGLSDMYNHAVSSATLMDMFGILQCYADKGITRFDTVIIGIDPVMLLEDPEKRWITLAPQYQAMCEKLGVEQIQPDKLNFYLDKMYEVISPQYLYENLFEYEAVTFSKETKHDKTVELTDGSLLYDAAKRNKSVAEKQRMIEGKISQVRSENRDLASIKVAYLSSLVKFLSGKTHKIYFVKSPNESAYWARVTTLNPTQIEADQVIDSISQAYNIEVLGHYSVDSLGYEYFYDQSHPSRELMEQILDF